ncbi:hypothetical protein HAX54_027581, partial [Datura stramonium]|nr:hypothetical protein [Datura stramonium]
SWNLEDFLEGLDGWYDESSCRPTSFCMIHQVCRVEERVDLLVVTISACDESSYHLATVESFVGLE